MRTTPRRLYLAVSSSLLRVRVLTASRDEKGAVMRRYGVESWTMIIAVPRVSGDPPPRIRVMLF